MSVFRRKGEKLTVVPQKKISLERDLQRLTEANLEAVLGYKFIVSEFALNGLRIDSLAYDPESKSFIIIEYKRDRSFSIIDQGYAYLSLLLNNKAEFILAFNRQTNERFDKDDIDWSQSRVLFLANNFTAHQLQAINFRDLPIELWEVKYYENETIVYHQLKPAQHSESITTVSGTGEAKEITSAVRRFSVEDHFPEQRQEAKELFDALREQIFALWPELEEQPVKAYIGYKLQGANIFTIHAFNRKLRLDLNRSEPKDFVGRTELLREKPGAFDHYHQHITEMQIETLDDIEMAVGFIMQTVANYKNGL